jgi:molybdopterin synthase catalytic subunit
VRRAKVFARPCGSFRLVPARPSPRIPRVTLTRGRFDVQRATDALRRADCGALLVYLGTVRSSPHGGGRKKVKRLEYEAYPQMALAKLGEVRRAALQRFDIADLLLHHRVGNFAVGEDVVMCVVAAPHRGAALQAAAFAIAEMKQTVPIWKKVFVGGGARWVVGEMAVKEVVSRPPSKRARPKA